MIGSKSVSTCNRSLARLVDSSIIHVFWSGHPPRGSKLTPLKCTFNAENFIRRLSWSILNGFGAVHTWTVCGSLKSRIKFTENPYFGVQGRSRSSMLVPSESSSAVLVMIRSKSVSVCNRSHARRANSGKITILGGTPIWCSRSRGISTSSGKTCSQETRDYAIIRWKPGVSVSSGLESIPGRARRTDRRTDGPNYDS